MHHDMLTLLDGYLAQLRAARDQLAATRRVAPGERRAAVLHTVDLSESTCRTPAPCWPSSTRRSRRWRCSRGHTVMTTFARAWSISRYRTASGAVAERERAVDDRDDRAGLDQLPQRREVLPARAPRRGRAPGGGRSVTPAAPG